MKSTAAVNELMGSKSTSTLHSLINFNNDFDNDFQLFKRCHNAYDPVSSEYF